MEKNKQNGENFCICCGQDSATIITELLKKKFGEKGKRYVGTHNQHINQDRYDYYYSDDLYIKNCGNCGATLTDDDINSQSEFMGYYGSARACQDIVHGYRCHLCGYSEKF